MTLLKLEFANDWFNQYNQLYASQQFTDCQIVSKDAIFHVHRLFLAAASPILSKVFQEIPNHDEEAESVLLMPDFDLAEMMSFLNLMYGVPNPDDILPVPLTVIEQLLNLSLDVNNEKDASLFSGQQGLPEATRDLLENNHRLRQRSEEMQIKRKLGETLAQPENHLRKSKRCFMCTAVRKSQEDLLDHVREEHGQDIFGCTKDLLDDLELKTYSCCDKVFFDKQRWSRHRLLVHQKVISSIRQPLRCSNCEHGFVFTQELQDVTYHNTTGLTEYRCPLGCQKMFRSRRNLSDHLEGCLLLQKVLCPFCGDFLSLDRESQQRSATLAARSAAAVKTMKSKANHRQRNNNCHLCQDKFPRFEELELHLKRAHEISTKYPCGLCGRVYGSLKKLKLHQHLHDGRFACPTCRKLFDHKTALTLHQAQHSRQGLECYACSKTFYSREKLEDHINTHTGHRPHKCDQCDFASVQQSGLAHHKRRLHSGEVRVKAI